jgi:predicted PurR-regulated permease PerM
MGIIVDLILTLVYIFLFLYFRGHIRNFIYKIVPANERGNTRTILADAAKVAQQYLTGLASMIVILWIMYSIGFSIVGVKNAVFFAILCGLLEIVPFVGNITGTTITVLMTIAQGGDTRMVAGVIITYGIVQFIQTYILEPLVVGSEVNINPLFTIMVLVLGELLWGIPGMILAIPLLGIAKIVFDHVEPLKPYGYLIGQEKKKSTGLLDKLRKIFRKKG